MLRRNPIDGDKYVTGEGINKSARSATCRCNFIWVFEGLYFLLLRGKPPIDTLKA
jgi:hypothetical protein